MQVQLIYNISSGVVMAVLAAGLVYIKVTTGRQNRELQNELNTRTEQLVDETTFSGKLNNIEKRLQQYDQKQVEIENLLKQLGNKVEDVEKDQKDLREEIKGDFNNVSTKFSDLLGKMNDEVFDAIDKLREEHGDVLREQNVGLSEHYDTLISLSRMVGDLRRSVGHAHDNLANEAILLKNEEENQDQNLIDNNENMSVESSGTDTRSQSQEDNSSNCSEGSQSDDIPLPTDQDIRNIEVYAREETNAEHKEHKEREKLRLACGSLAEYPEDTEANQGGYSNSDSAGIISESDFEAIGGIDDEEMQLASENKRLQQELSKIEEEQFVRENKVKMREDSDVDAPRAEEEAKPEDAKSDLEDEMLEEDNS